MHIICPHCYVPNEVHTFGNWEWKDMKYYNFWYHSLWWFLLIIHNKFSLYYRALLLTVYLEQWQQAQQCPRESNGKELTSYEQFPRNNFPVHQGTERGILITTSQISIATVPKHYLVLPKLLDIIFEWGWHNHIILQAHKKFILMLSFCGSQIPLLPSQLFLRADGREKGFLDILRLIS